MTLAVLLALVAAGLLLCSRAISTGRRADRVGTVLYRAPESRLRGLRPDPPPSPPADAPTAVLFVGGFEAVGLEALVALRTGYGAAFARVVFAAARTFDDPAGSREAEGRALLETLERSLRGYAPVAALGDLATEIRVAAGPDPVDALVRLAGEIAVEFPRAVFLIPRVEIEDKDRALGERLRRRGFATAELWIPVRVRA